MDGRSLRVCGTTAAAGAGWEAFGLAHWQGLGAVYLRSDHTAGPQGERTKPQDARGSSQSGRLHCRAQGTPEGVGGRGGCGETHARHRQWRRGGGNAGPCCVLAWAAGAQMRPRRPPRPLSLAGRATGTMVSDGRGRGHVGRWAAAAGPGRRWQPCASRPDATERGGGRRAASSRRTCSRSLVGAAWQRPGYPAFAAAAPAARAAAAPAPADARWPCPPPPPASTGLHRQR